MLLATLYAVYPPRSPSAIFNSIRLQANRICMVEPCVIFPFSEIVQPHLDLRSSMSELALAACWTGVLVFLRSSMANQRRFRAPIRASFAHPEGENAVPSVSLSIYLSVCPSSSLSSRSDRTERRQRTGLPFPLGSASVPAGCIS